MKPHIERPEKISSFNYMKFQNPFMDAYVRHVALVVGYYKGLYSTYQVI